jgi:hypothetical protein
VRLANEESRPALPSHLWFLTDEHTRVFLRLSRVFDYTFVSLDVHSCL